MTQQVINPLTGDFDLVNTADDFAGDFVNVTGDTMTGQLNVPALDTQTIYRQVRTVT